MMVFEWFAELTSPLNSFGWDNFKVDRQREFNVSKLAAGAGDSEQGLFGGRRPAKNQGESCEMGQRALEAPLHHRYRG